MSNLGFPTELDSQTLKVLGDVSRIGYANLYQEETDEGIWIGDDIVARKDVSIVVDVGDNVHYPNLNEPPVMNYGSCFFDMMKAFKNGDPLSTNKYAEKCWGYELELIDDNSITDMLSTAENNIEYCMYDDTIVKNVVAEGCALINPSRGSVSRLDTVGLLKYVEEVFIIKGSDADYITSMKILCNETNLKVNVVSGRDLDKDRRYFLSFNGDFAEKYKLSNYFGFVINPYQAVYNEVVTQLNYHEKGIGVTYFRREQKKEVFFKYLDYHAFKYGSDYFYERYKNVKSFKPSHALMYDLVSSFKFNFGSAKIIKGRIPIANCFCLIGDYTDDGVTIFKGDKAIYSASPIVHSNRGLHDDWIPLQGSLVQLQRASYIIGIFSSVCVSLGERYYVRDDGNVTATYRGVNIKVSKDYLHGCVVLGADIKGDYRIDEKNFSVVNAVPYNVHLADYYAGGSYCYGTYHTIVRSINYVGETKSLSQLIREGL